MWMGALRIGAADDVLLVVDVVGPRIELIYFWKQAHLCLEASSSISGGKLIYFGSFYTYALVHTYIRTCIHTYVHNVRNKHTYIRAYVRTYVHVHTRKCMYTYLHVSMLVYLTSFFFMYIHRVQTGT